MLAPSPHRNLVAVVPLRPRTGVRRPRVALYGHDTIGLGHFRRNQALAHTFAGADAADAVGADVLILTGAPEAGRFPRPAGVDLVVLPGIDKDLDGAYAPSHLRTALDDVVRLRAAVARAALRAFEPDVVIVDKVPLGFGRELASVLPELRGRGVRLVLGLRDVLDDPIVARAEWHDSRATDTVRALYDEIWVYGDRRVHDVVAACALPPTLATRTHHLGYLAHGRPPVTALPADVAGRRPYVVACAGGGRDGAAVATTFAATPFPDAHRGVLVTGPQLAPAVRHEVRAIAAERDDLDVLDFTADLAGYLSGAAAAVSMAGANTVAEVLGSDVPALLVPRVYPRREQLVRAEGLARQGLVDVASADQLAPDVLAAWLAGAVGRRVDRSGLALDGLAAARTRLRALLDREPAAAPAHLTLLEDHDVAV